MQCAAWRACFPKWKLYTNYAILGDDVVIGDARVATQYLEIMKSLGVGVNTSKSLLSHRGTAFEFAKRTVVNGVDCSPVAFKEFFAATRHLGAFIEMVGKFSVPLPLALQAMGVGWRVRSGLDRPLGKLSARLRLVILALNIPRVAEDVAPFFKLGQSRAPRYRNESIKVVHAFIDVEMSKLFGLVHKFAPLSLGGGVSHVWALNLAKAYGKIWLGLDPEFSSAWEGES